MIMSTFPNLLDFSFTATAVLRITLGIIFIWFAYAKYFKEKHARIAFFEKLGLHPAHIYFTAITALEGFVGALLLVGAYTQVAALTTGVLMTLASIIKWRKPSALPHNTIEFYILLAVVSFVLMSLGAGAFAFDLHI